MKTGKQKEAVLVIDAAAKSSIPIIESCAAMGLHVIAASHKKYCCGFYSRRTHERIIYPSPETNPEAFMQCLLNFLKKLKISMIFPLGHLFTAFIAQHQDALKQHTRIILPPYDVFIKGLSKIPTLKAASQIGCPTPKTWFPKEQPLQDIAKEAGYPVLIKPAIGIGGRGMKLCRSPKELIDEFPKIEARFGESFVQEFIPQTGIQYKTAIILDYSHQLISGIVYAKLRYYPPNGGSSTLNKTVHRPDIMQNAYKVAKHLKWVGTCDFDFITDPRDNTAKMMEINPRFSDTYKMASVAGMDMTKIMYQLAKGEEPEKQFEYQKDKYMRFIFGDIMWFLKDKEHRWSAKPGFFDFFRSDTTYLMTGINDIGPMIGYILENLSMLWDKEARQFRLRSKNL